jgi:hypothetical protein
LFIFNFFLKLKFLFKKTIKAIKKDLCISEGELALLLFKFNNFNNDDLSLQDIIEFLDDFIFSNQNILKDVFLNEKAIYSNYNKLSYTEVIYGNK